MCKSYNWLYGFATTLQERINILKESFPLDESLSSLNKWCSRKTLLTHGDFNEMLKSLNISKEEFDLGVSELTEDKLKILYHYVKKQKWFQLHNHIFSFNVPNISYDLDTALRFHLEYYEQEIRSYINSCSVSLSEYAIQGLINTLKSDLQLIANPTLVWDVHDIKERMGIDESNSNIEFRNYIIFRFSTVKSIKNFYLEYPALSRLLITRLIFAIDNFKLFIHSLLDASTQLWKIFNISFPYTITSVEAKNSDSHNYGKSTIIFTINEKRLVYKYHDNHIRLFFNNFLEYINSLSPELSLYCPKCITTEDYCIEEYISNDSCQVIEEIETYYIKYGMLIAIAHWFGSTDLHMENLIAHGSEPVLIDIETLLLSEEQRIYSHKLSKNQIMEKNSVIISGLLPMHRYWKRQLDFSALNGIRQKMPYKVRKLLNEKSSDIIYKLEEGYLNPAKNIPLLNNCPVTFNTYSGKICEGYIKTMNLFLAHKNELLQFCMLQLQDQSIRVLLRDTQDYWNFLNFSTHPSCMSDFIEHEKVLQNLWNHSFISNKMISHETNALTYYDIPYFYTKVNSYDLFSIDKTVTNFFMININNIFKNHIYQLCTENVNFSLILIKEATNSLEYKLENISIPSHNDYGYLPLSLAADIKDVILKSVVINEKYKTIIWPEVTHEPNSSSPNIHYPDSNFYNGTSGLYVFLYAIKYYTKTDIPLLPLLEQEVFNNDFSSNIISAFYGHGAQLLTSFILFRLTHEKKFYNYIVTQITNLLAVENYHNSNEWLKGCASILCLLARIIETMNLPQALDLVKKITKFYTIKDINTKGFAHGYAGALFSLIRVNSILNNNKLKNIINELAHLLVSSSFDNISSSWCRGTLGINRALKAYSIYSPNSNITWPTDFVEPTYSTKNSCICHGKYGDISAYIEQLACNDISESHYNQIVSDILKDPLILSSSENLIPLGMFTGITGIGYQLLRLYDPSLFDILFFI